MGIKELVSGLVSSAHLKVADSESEEVSNQAPSFEDIQSEAVSIYQNGGAIDPTGSEEVVQAVYRAQKLQQDIDANRQFLNMQRDWGWHIQILLWLVILFQFAFVFLIGFNFYSFADNLNKIPNIWVGIILQSLASIITLGMVVTQFLFPKK